MQYLRCPDRTGRKRQPPYGQVLPCPVRWSAGAEPKTGRSSYRSSMMVPILTPASQRILLIVLLTAMGGARLFAQAEDPESEAKAALLACEANLAAFPSYKC